MTAKDMPTEDTVEALTLEFTRVVRELFAAETVDATLTNVLSLAVETIEGCDLAGIVLAGQPPTHPPVHTDPSVAGLNALQDRLGEGPGLDAVTAGTISYAPDLASDSRWPRFGTGAVASDVRSMLAVPLVSDSTLGSLNLYARYPEAFGVIDRARGLLLASVAAIAYSAVRTQLDVELGEANLRAALITREIIGQAQGILIERERITADQAFDILRRASQHLNRKLREVAQLLVDTGEDPDTGPRQPS